MGTTTSAPDSSSKNPEDIVTIKSESPAHDDSLTLSDYEEQVAKDAAHPIPLQPPPIRFNISPSDPQWEDFKFLATKFIYAEDAFPNDYRMKEACVKIANSLNWGESPPTGTSYHISHGLVKKFHYIGKDNRRHVHEAVERWILSFEWPISSFPLICSTSKAELYKYLTYHARFARGNYNQNGRMLQNHCLAHCLNYIMFKDKRTRASFENQQLNKPVPRPLIVYIMVMIHYNLEKLACKYERLQTKNRASKWSPYYPPTTWHRTEYRALLSRSSKQGRQLQWDRITESISKKLDGLEETEEHGADYHELDDLLGTSM
ncbi:hypothetical protein BJV82DRAFT_666250 [Fennellomyces sp. T-0311]|nr:hypothetical protein BJV82DRAFT_666250 [Fennellomyces sp. T-0311]